MPSPCLTLDGVNDVGKSSDFLSGGSALSVAVWIYRSAAGADCAVSQWDTNSQRGWKIATSSGGDKLEVFVDADGGGTTYKQYTTTESIVLNTWTHVAFVFSSGTLKLYIGGSEVTPTKTVDNAVSLFHNSTAVVTVGASLATGSTAETWSGRLLDVRVYTAALTDQNIADIYAGTYVGTPVAYWPCCESGGTLLYDVSGNGYHATLTGGTEATYWANTQDEFDYASTYGFRQITRGRSFNGTNQYLQKAADTEFDTGTAGQANHTDFWVAAWVNAAVLGDAVFSKWNVVAGGREWMIDTSGSVARLFVSSTGSDSGSVQIAMSTGQWQLIFAYHDATADEISIAIDGGTFATPTAWNLGVWANDNDLVLGAYKSAGTPGLHFTGNIRLAAMGKPPSNPASWTAIRDAIYNNGDVLTYDDLSAGQKTDWGVVDWFDMDAWTDKDVETGRHAGTVLTGSNMSDDRVPKVGALVSAPTNHYQSFNGSTHVYEAANESAFRSGTTGSANNTDFWIAMWIIVPKSGYSTQTLFGKIDNSAPIREWMLYLSSGDNLRVWVSDDGLATPTLINIGATPSERMLAVAYHDATADILALTKNNNAFATSAHTTGVWSSTAPVTIGARNNGSSIDLQSNAGVICAAYGRPPSNPSDWTVLRDLLYNSGTPISYADLSAANKSDWGLVAFYDCDDVGSGSLIDSHGTNHMVGLSIPSATTHTLIVSALADIVGTHTASAVADVIVVALASNPGEHSAEAIADIIANTLAENTGIHDAQAIAAISSEIASRLVAKPSRHFTKEMLKNPKWMDAALLRDPVFVRENL